MPKLNKIRIFVATPSDVTAERMRLDIAIGTLRPMADYLGLTLEAVDWRHVVPDAGRPQQVILDQLRPTTWDVFVGVLWHRFGTPSKSQDPATNREYLSGTEEEFRVAYSLHEQFGKPRIVMYRCIRPIPQEADLFQAQRVKEFFKEIQDPAGTHRVLSQSFLTAKDFEKLLIDHFQKLLIEFSNNEAIERPPEEDFQSLLPSVPDNLPARKFFAGRTMEIKTIMEALSPAERGWGATIDGIGGVGKTALAIEVAHLCKELGGFDAFVFMSAKQTELTPEGIIDVSVTGDIASIDGLLTVGARVLGIPNALTLEGEPKKRAFLNALRESRTLLIFDNVETLALEEQEALVNWLRFLPSDCKAIITSRRHLGGGSQWVRLGKLGWEDAKAVL